MKLCTLWMHSDSNNGVVCLEWVKHNSRKALKLSPPPWRGNRKWNNASEIINLSVLSMLYHAEPAGAVLFSPLHNSHTHAWIHSRAGSQAALLVTVHTNSTSSAQPWNVFSHYSALTCSHTLLTRITSFPTGRLSVLPTACSYSWLVSHLELMI